jgi:hypothetical protein
MASFLMLVASVIAFVIQDIGYFWVMFALMVISILQNISVYKHIYTSEEPAKS